MLEIRDNKLYADTATLRAVVASGTLISLVNKRTGKELLNAENAADGGLQLVYAGNQAVAVTGGPEVQETLSLLGEHTAELRLEGWHANGVVLIEEDPESGELCFTPSAYASRSGVRSARWQVCGIARDLKLVLPAYQGTCLAFDDPLFSHEKMLSTDPLSTDTTRMPWPREWEAGFAICQGEKEGFWVWTQDTQYRCKTLRIGAPGDPWRLGFEAETWGPTGAAYSAGGLTWRVGVYEGGWQIPAARYRSWLYDAYHLERVTRPDWVKELTLAVVWMPVDDAYLDGLARCVRPEKTLLHVPRWRNFGYDQNYPNYDPSPEAAAFIKRARQMGFHVAPHANAFETDPTNPAYQLVGQFEYREIETDRRLGWSFVMHEDGTRSFPGVPMSNRRLMTTQVHKTMTKIHPAQPMWQSLLCESLVKAKRQLGLDSIFADVSHNTFNLNNCLVNNTTAIQGANQLVSRIAALDGGLQVGGEGLNELTMQVQAFSQTHLFRSSGGNVEGLERTGGVPLGDFLWGGLCRPLGYSSINGRTPAEELRMRLHEEHGCVPTITLLSQTDLVNPNPMLKHFLELANR